MAEQFIIRGSVITDIITNSSSVVYSYASGKTAIFTVIDEILKDVGSKKTAKDLYDVFVVAECLLDNYYVGETLAAEPEAFEEFFGIPQEQYWGHSGDDQLKLVKERRKELSPETLERLSENLATASENETCYIVRKKDGSESSIGNLVASLFYHEGSYDG